MSNRKIRQAIREAELSRLYREHGALTASLVVEAASDEESPLHQEFNWDDAEAAHEYRLQQARQMLRVTVVAVDGGAARTRFVHVPALASESTREGTYEPISVVVQQPDKYARALSELAAKMRSATAAMEELRTAAEQSTGVDSERMARITVAITALQTASAAVQALH